MHQEPDCHTHYHKVNYWKCTKTEREIEILNLGVYGDLLLLYTNTLSVHFGPKNLLLKWQIIITCITSFTVFSNYNEGDLTINVLAPKGTFVCTRQLDPENWDLKLGKISCTAPQIFWQSSTLCTIQKWNGNICIGLISLIQTNYINLFALVMCHCFLISHVCYPEK